MSANSRTKAINSSPFGGKLGGFSLGDLQNVITGENAAAQPGSAIEVSGDGSLQIGAVRLSPRGLIIDGEMSRAEFDALGGVIGRLHGGVQWIAGDYMAAAEITWKQTYEQIAALMGVDKTALYQYAYVARAVDFSMRIETLSFTHHQIVAGMDAALQGAWLRYAAALGWKTAALRAAIKLLDRVTDLGLRVQWIEHAIAQHWDIAALESALDSAFDPPTLSSENEGESAQKSLFSIENAKQMKKIAKIVEKAKRGDERSRLTVLGWITTVRDQLDALAESMGQGGS